LTPEQRKAIQKAAREKAKAEEAEKRAQQEEKRQAQMKLAERTFTCKYGCVKTARTGYLLHVHENELVSPPQQKQLASPVSRANRSLSILLFASFSSV
jgi:hypothetical protein